ncbi:MAG: universal stress protein [Kofleriaceae bacterium]|nr:universal stress protein [Myxococcales bacterium]MCB9559600.1 universal stress protein [Kofleriaceae bacterium]MCB9574315.1 universal stress protein [Kofleriaceae bacterium]
MWKTLLVPHDFSPCAEKALSLAVDLARQEGGAIVLVHVTHLPPGLTADAMLSDGATGQLVRVDAYARNGATERLEGIAAPLRETGLQITTRTTLGDVADEILDVARDIDADIIVMGTHGRTGLKHLFLGSMTEKVLREASIPVLTVRVEA